MHLPKDNGVIKYSAMVSENQSPDNVQQSHIHSMETLRPLCETVKVTSIAMETPEDWTCHWFKKETADVESTQEKVYVNCIQKSWWRGT